MIKLLRSTLCALLSCGGAAAIDLNGLRSIGPVASLVKTDSDVTVTCADGSQVRIAVLAPDLIRVRAAFLGKLPDRDHSWAIEKTSWDAPRWSLVEDVGTLRISTDELEVVVHRSPLQIEFRDVKTHQTINSDQQALRFHPQSGLIAAAKKLGFDEHFYGLGEKATRLDKRRGEFVMWNSDTFAYQEGTDPLYQSIPFSIGWQPGAAYGTSLAYTYPPPSNFRSP